jgi:MFS family permease
MKDIDGSTHLGLSIYVESIGIPIIMIQTQRYQQIFQFRAFRLFWFGFTFSVMGDAATRVALTWFVFEKTNSATALGILSLTYTGPIIISGLFVGSILDRFDRRKVMIADNLIRGTIMMLIPLLHLLGILALWHIYLASLVYGSLVMVSLAGSPALVPDLIDEDHLATANALETLSYTLSAVIGPLLAGFLIPVIGAPLIVFLDATSYILFAFLLIRMSIPSRNIQHEHSFSDEAKVLNYRFVDAVRLLLHNRILLSTTLMFMAVNLGFGAFLVVLPIFSTNILHGGSGLYGILLGALAIGELSSSLLVGTLDLPLSLGKLISIAQVSAGVALAILLFGFSIPIALVSMVLFGFMTAPLTIWAQTLRMKVIPSALRGRTFALLRMLMQSTNPVGGVAGGFLLPLVSFPVMIALSATIIGIPGILGLLVRELRNAR